MPDIGRIQSLAVDHVDDRGAWLRGDDEPILLPRKEIAGGAKPGERLPVFVFRDSAGHLRATLRHPLAQVGEFARLSVRSVGPHGAFLDWGVEKDLLVPFRHQPQRMEEGRSYLVRLCLDREGRPFASARIDQFIEEKASGLTEGEAVPLVLWQFTDLGAKVLVKHRFVGLLYRDELTSDLRVGDRLAGFVKHLREDGRIDVTLRKVGAEGIQEGKGKLLSALRERGGFLPFHDGTPPGVLQRELGMSKKMFKKAVGGLYKEGKLTLETEGIRLRK